MPPSVDFNAVSLLWWLVAAFRLVFAFIGILSYVAHRFWEFLPAFFAVLVPGADLVPFWTLAVANVYRKWKIVVTAEESRGQHPAVPNPRDSC